VRCAASTRRLLWLARGLERVGGSGFFGVVLSYTVAVYRASKCLRLRPPSQSAAIGTR